MSAARIIPLPDTAPDGLMPDMRGFSATPSLNGVGSLHLRPCAFLTLAQALFVEDEMRSIQQSVQNGQFLCRFAQDASDRLVASHAEKRCMTMLVYHDAVDVVVRSESCMLCFLIVSVNVIVAQGHPG